MLLLLYYRWDEQSVCTARVLSLSKTLLSAAARWVRKACKSLSETKRARTTHTLQVSSPVAEGEKTRYRIYPNPKQKKRVSKKKNPDNNFKNTRTERDTCSEAHPGRWLLLLLLLLPRLLLSVVSFFVVAERGAFFVATTKAASPVLRYSGKIRFFCIIKNEQQRRRKDDEEEARLWCLLLLLLRAKTTKTKRRCKDKTERP